jgi:hypothetical protein
MMLRAGVVNIGEKKVRFKGGDVYHRWNSAKDGASEMNSP